jgi:hypothetical protein
MNLRGAGLSDRDVAARTSEQHNCDGHFQAGM